MKEIILVILGSSVTAAIVTSGIDSFKDRKRKEEERYQKFYGPLKFYLMLINSVTENRKEIHQSNQKILRENRESINIINKEFPVMGNFLTAKWWGYLEKINCLIQENPQYIKQEHLGLISKFIDGYLKREMIGKEDASKEVPFALEERYDEYLGKIIEAIDNLNRELL